MTLISVGFFWRLTANFWPRNMCKVRHTLAGSFSCTWVPWHKEMNGESAMYCRLLSRFFYSSMLSCIQSRFKADSLDAKSAFLTKISTTTRYLWHVHILCIRLCYQPTHLIHSSHDLMVPWLTLCYATFFRVERMLCYRNYSVLIPQPFWSRRHISTLYTATLSNSIFSRSSTDQWVT